VDRYEALIVDFGGVLTTSLDKSMAVFAEALGIEFQDLVRAALRAYSGFEDDLVKGFETGVIPEAEFSIGFAKRLEEETGKTIDPSGLVDKIFDSLEPEEEMYTAVALAKDAGLRTALCSNSWGMGLYPLERFPELFDVVVISGEVGMRKPDRNIFDLTVERLGVNHDVCVFVDDHPGHLATAQEIGMSTVLHRSPTDTIAELQALLGIDLT
jgi:epoxide hydrolase-like predicted phosphatase